MKTTLRNINQGDYIFDGNSVFYVLYAGELDDQGKTILFLDRKRFNETSYLEGSPDTEIDLLPPEDVALLFDRLSKIPRHPPHQQEPR